MKCIILVHSWSSFNCLIVFFNCAKLQSYKNNHLWSKKKQHIHAWKTHASHDNKTCLMIWCHLGALQRRSPLCPQWCEPVLGWNKCWLACYGSRWRTAADCSWGPESPVSGTCRWSRWEWPRDWERTLPAAAAAGWWEGSDSGGWPRSTCWSRRRSSLARWACLHRVSSQVYGIWKNNL